MERTYRVIREIKIEEQYEDSPIQVLFFQVLEEEKMERRLLCCKMKNIGERSVKGCILAFVGHDETGREQDEVEKFEYKNLSIESGECFGEDIFIPISTVTSERFHFYIEHVFFTDKTVWNSKRILTMEHPQQLISESDLEVPMKKACKKFGILKQAKYIPDLVDRFWRCTCGEMNPSNENFCAKCGVERSLLHQVFDVNYLGQMQEEMLYKKKRKKEKQRRERNQQIKQNLGEKTEGVRKWSLRIGPMLGIAVLFMGIVYVGTKVLLPKYYYETGRKELRQERYVLAKEAFQKAKEYEDAGAYQKYAAVLAELDQVSDDTNVGQIYNEICNLGEFKEAALLLKENQYLKKISQIQGEWNLYDESKKKTYKIERGNVTINGQTVFQIVACGEGIGLQSGTRGEVLEIISVTKNEMVTEVESKRKVFHKNSTKNDSIYFPVESYEEVISSMQEEKQAVLEKMKKKEKVFACRQLLEYLYGEDYVDFAKLNKAYARKLDTPGELILSDGSIANTHLEVYVDIIEKDQEKQEEGSVNTRHYVGYFDETGENLLAYNELRQEIPKRKNDEKLVEEYHSYEVPNLMIPVCKKAIETELKKEGELMNQYFHVLLVDTELSLNEERFVHIWGKTSMGEYKRIDAMVNADYQIEDTTSTEERVNTELYAGTPVLDYGAEFAVHFK